MDSVLMPVQQVVTTTREDRLWHTRSPLPRRHLAPLELLARRHLPLERLPLERLPLERLPLERLPLERLPLERLPLERLPLERFPLERLQLPLQKLVQPSKNHPKSSSLKAHQQEIILNTP